MKKTAALLALALLAMQACAAQEIIRPETVNYADVIIEMGASGSFSGNLSEQDTMSVKFIVPSEREGQEVEYLEEALKIGVDTYKARHEDINGIMYAVFEIPDLHKYAETPQFEITVKAGVKRAAKMELGGDFTLGKGIRDAETGEFLKPTDYIESDTQELADFANSEFRGTSEIEAIRGITEWVNSNVTYDKNYSEEVNSALDTFRIRRGVCDEFANLTAALMRAKGIPARYVSGISYDGESFGNHGWIEAFLPGTGWVSVDSTYGEAGYVDALHFTLAQSADANAVSNITVATSTIEPVKAEMKLLDPKVSIRELGFFRGVAQASVRKDKVESMQKLSLAVEMKSASESNIIVPVGLELHREFTGKSASKRLVWLKPGEWGTAEFSAVAPAFETENAYGRYEFIVLLPDGNMGGFIEVYPQGGLSVRIEPLPQMGPAEAAMQAARALAIAGLVLVIAVASIFVLKHLLSREI